MALITCEECGKEFSDKAVACPNCGCPTPSLSTSTIPEPETAPVELNSATDEVSNPMLSAASSLVSSASSALKHRASIKKVGPIQIDEQNRQFRVHGAVAVKKKTGLIGGTMKGALAITTLGMSVVAEKAIKGTQKVGTKEWYSFSDLLNYELLEDDSIVTSGGVGQALIGGALFGGFGAITGGVTASRTQKKKIETMHIKVTLNDFSTPCIMIPLITKPTTTKSVEYQTAFKLAHDILSIFDVITHNK